MSRGSYIGCRLSCSPSRPMTPGTQYARPERNLREDPVWHGDFTEEETEAWRGFNYWQAHEVTTSWGPRTPSVLWGFLHIMAWIVNSRFTWCPHCTVITHWGQPHLSYWSWQTQCLSQSQRSVNISGWMNQSINEPISVSVNEWMNAVAVPFTSRRIVYKTGKERVLHDREDVRVNELSGSGPSTSLKVKVIQ